MRHGQSSPNERLEELLEILLESAIPEESLNNVIAELEELASCHDSIPRTIESLRTRKR
jgi:hypothetical protein